MALSYFYRLLFLFAAACKITTAVSTTASSGCTAEIRILGKDEVRQQLESHLQNNMDIVEIHIRPNTSISIITDNGNIANETFVSASTTEKYNMFVYFIVTDTGKTILKYPVDADTLSFGALGSHKVLMDIDIFVANKDCALSTEQFRNLFLNDLLTIAPVQNNSDISVCYFTIPIFNLISSQFILLPYHTYNQFPTFCLRDGMTDNLPQAFSNILLWRLCIVILMTLPLVLHLIPHSEHDQIQFYRQHDVPFSIPLLMTYIEYWKPDMRQSVEANPSTCLKDYLMANFIWNPLRRGFIVIVLISFLFGVIVKQLVHENNALEKELLIISGSSAFFSSNYVVFLFLMLYFVITAVLLDYQMWILLSRIEIAPYNMYVFGNKCLCEDINDLNLPPETTAPLLYSKMVSETLLSCSFWKKLCMQSKIMFPLNCIIVIIWSIPMVNEAISLLHSIKEANPKSLFRKISLYIGCLNWLFMRLIVINIMLMQTATLILQVTFLSLFVAIPIYPTRFAYFALVIGIIKFIVQTVMQFQTKAKLVLTYVFEELEEQGRPTLNLRKHHFRTVLKHCPSVNECDVIIKLIAFSFASFTAYTAINQDDNAAMLWSDIIPPIIIFLGPDCLSKFFYNKEADNNYIRECVKRQVSEMMENNTFDDRTESETTPLCGVN